MQTLSLQVQQESLMSFVIKEELDFEVLAAKGSVCVAMSSHVIIQCGMQSIGVVCKPRCGQAACMITFGFAPSRCC